MSLGNSIASLSIPLEQKLEVLREYAREGGQNESLVRWAELHPEIATCGDWCERAWWGVTAGKITRDHLDDRAGNDEALRLLVKADCSLIEEMRGKGGCIVATAHLGPPKFLMHAFVKKTWPLMVWTNTKDLPEWLTSDRASTFLSPMLSGERGALMVRSALHLKQGGILLGAADMTTGERIISRERLGRTWRFSLGLPALARQLNVPVVACLALWKGNAVELACRPIVPPAFDLPETAWYEEWIERYWAILEKIIKSSPENLRFMRRVFSLDEEKARGSSRPENHA